MLNRLAYRFHQTLEHHFPEQRLFLKSDTETRFIRLRPATQLIALVGGTLALAWTIVATAVIMMDTIGAGSAREQSARAQARYEERLNALSADRDLRAEEAARAQERYNLALAQVSDMQERLLASEDRRRELETGIDAIQETLRRTIKERDEARAEAERATLALNEQHGGATEIGRIRDAVATLEFLVNALGLTAEERDEMLAAADAAREEARLIAEEKRALEQRNDLIFSRLEEAVTVSMEPLNRMFREAGMSPEDLLKTIRRGYSGQGGPLTPISMSTSGAVPTPEELRANAILDGLDEMNMYRIAAFKLPFAIPVKDRFRWTSGFGYRRDPKGAGTRMHEGTDMAGAYGTPIYATADGVVVHAGWDNGYGRLVTIRHDFGVETRYAHLSQIRVEVGQRVSRGDRIGDMGNSGRSTGTHLHYEVRLNGSPVNPMTFIKAAKNVF
ncbi:M23 family metallopeptidase [Tabrizicola sp. YIM 78059]|uniref:M23 family metallopeptidase n=1 Tax=Tabrizicola sp. YIM 78059 TaxID=2529861 RepID=UPI0010AAC74A|nr:M23 family metallopeptidase [Tabrizicola sp. YIM 78059]